MSCNGGVATVSERSDARVRAFPRGPVFWVKALAEYFLAASVPRSDPGESSVVTELSPYIVREITKGVIAQIQTMPPDT